MSYRNRFENVVRKRADMHQYQRDAYAFLRERPYSALFIDMGLGKTITSLTVAVDILAEFEVDKVLIIGPLRVATETWPTEIGLWEHTAAFNHSLIHVRDKDPRLKEAAAKGRDAARAAGMKGKDVTKLGQDYERGMRSKLRQDAANSKASIHIVSRDWVEWLVNHHGRKWPYRCVIIDESSGFKDHNSTRFKALAKVRNTPGLITRLHCLTATPAAETYEHLFAQVFLMDGGLRFGKSITRFREEYFTYNKYSMKWKLRPGAEEEILSKISDICLVMKAEDYLDLDKPHIVPRQVSLDDDQMALYRKMETDFIVELPGGIEVEAETAASLSQKLLQMASGVLYETREVPGEGDGEVARRTVIHELHDHKIDALKQIMEEAQGEQVLVAYHHKASLDRLRRVFPNATVMDREGKCVKTWNQRALKFPMLLIHPQSGGHGLNMQHGGRFVVFYDLPWSLELYLQLIGRLARQGQKELVVVQPLITKGTLDEYVFESLSVKEDAQEKLFTLLKRMIRRAKTQRISTNSSEW